ncbi:MAG: phosphoribosylformimino-5-aminoimidazole carboxamide ribotide isomerase [Lachnospiraceae bacterium]|nr:phosphoribosylformimino-5-aminoimidazole carboxamide ribotide isomerase [Lachnospiraceae bacterium]
MKFRPCIDIHNGHVKQIVGSSLDDQNGSAVENFVASQDASYFAEIYQKYGLKGGHIILLNKAGSPYYEETKKQAFAALAAYPHGMQIGGGICDTNAQEYLDAGASHVIVTSYVFHDGRINFENLEKINRITGKEQLVLDLSCRKRNGQYYIVTDRWQKDTEFALNYKNLDILAGYCDEFLIHAVDVEGKMEGIETELVKMLGGWGEIPITYAGGVRSTQDIDLLRQEGRGKLDVTIGSALSLYGGPMPFEETVKYINHQ